MDCSPCCLLLKRCQKMYCSVQFPEMSLRNSPFLYWVYIPEIHLIQSLMCIKCKNPLHSHVGLWCVLQYNCPVFGHKTRKLSFMQEVQCLSRESNRKHEELGTYSMCSDSFGWVPVATDRNSDHTHTYKDKYSTVHACLLIDDLCELQSKNKYTIATSA